MSARAFGSCHESPRKLPEKRERIRAIESRESRAKATIAGQAGNSERSSEALHVTPTGLVAGQRRRGCRLRGQYEASLKVTLVGRSSRHKEPPADGRWLD